jgi:hypothetical protein
VKRKTVKRIKQFRTPIIVALCVLTIAVAGTVTYAQITSKPSVQPSRQWMELSQSIIRRETHTGPTISARFYTYVANVYADTLDATNSSSQAGAAAGNMIKKIFPAYAGQVDSFAKGIGADKKLSPEADKIFNTYAARLTTDGYDLVGKATPPNDPTKWHTSSYPPSTPRAGEWKHWLVEGQTFATPAPPVFGSPADLAEIETVKKAVANRTPEDNAMIRFWAGNPGSESPSGIWVNRMYTIAGSKLTDKELARVQANMTRTMSDAFIECWKVKYAYWTQRPSMRIPNLDTSFRDPFFPSYVSGHAVVSAAVSDMLSYELPQYASTWHQDATLSAKSRLDAGIHFSVDTENGKALGHQVGAAAVNVLRNQGTPPIN